MPDHRPDCDCWACIQQRAAERGVAIDDAVEVLIRTQHARDEEWMRQHRNRCRRAEELTREILGDDD